jgi:hypothetical protein
MLCAALGASRVETATATEGSATLKLKCERADRILLEDGKAVPPGVPKSRQNVVINLKYLKECLAAGRLLPPCLYTE